MDLSEFKPPVRLSMSDEEIYQALGAAQASEDGIAKAMAIVEEQANLREHDNKLFSEWVGRMQSSEAPQAKIALENIERAKQNLEPLPLTPPAEDIVSSLNATYAAQIEQVGFEQEAHEISTVEPDGFQGPDVIEEEAQEAQGEQQEEEQLQSIFANLGSESSPEPQVEFEAEAETIQIEEPSIIQVEVLSEPEVSSEPEQDEFDRLLADAASEATTSISFANSVAEPAVTFEADSHSVENFEVSADEDALVLEETKIAQPKSGWWANTSFWLLSVGVIVPVIASYLAVALGATFGTAIFGFGLGLLANVGMIVSAHFTAQRTSESNVVTSRASFGVLGAIVPGVAGLAFALALLNLSAIGSVASFDGAFEGGFDFSQKLVGDLSISAAIAIGLVILAFMIAGFASRALRWLNLVAASLLTLAFFVGALITRGQIDSIDVSFSIDFSQVVLIAGMYSAVGLATYGKAPRVVGSHGTGKTVGRWSALLAAVLLLPLATFAHFTLIFLRSMPGTGFELLTPLGLTDLPALATPVLWLVALSLFVLLVNLGHSALGQLRAFGLNQIKGWLTIIVSLAATAIYVFPTWSFWLGVIQFLLVPLAAAVGVAVAESAIRRGPYHEASLLRGYGFYGKFNLVAVIGYFVVVAFGFGIATPFELAPWLGFAGWTTPLAFLLAFGLSALWTAVTGIPRILMQQREVAEVEQRKASLSSFSGFSE